MQQSTAVQHDSDATASRSWLGRLGGWAADHRRAIALVWCAVILTLGALAPVADRALSGAGWEAVDSESVAARHALEAQLPGRRQLRAVRGRRRSARGHRRPGRALHARARRRRPAQRRRGVGRAGPADLTRPQQRGRRSASRAGDRTRWSRPPAGSRRASRDLSSPGIDRPPHRTGRDVVGLQRGEQGGDAQVRAALVAADARAAGVRVRHARRRRPAAAAHDGRPPRRGRAAVRRRAVRRRVDLGDELRDDVRDRARDRLRALHRRPLPRPRSPRGSRRARRPW